MSYCSNVAITMFQEDYDRMVEQAKAIGGEDLAAIITTVPDVHDLLGSNGKNVVRLGYNCVKWNPYFDDVRFVEDFLNSGIAYHFIEICDDCDEPKVHGNLVDEDGGFEETVCPVVRRYISFD
jgi:hypothetical protein